MGEEGEKGFGVGKDFEIAGVGAVPFEEGEFGMVPAAVFAVASAGADLEDLFIAGGEQALHVQLGRGAHPAGSGGDGVDVVFRRVGGDGDGGVDFEKTSIAEKATDGVVQPGPQFQDAAQGAQGVGIGGFGVHDA